MLMDGHSSITFLFSDLPLGLSTATGKFQTFHANGAMPKAVCLEPDRRYRSDVRICAQSEYARANAQWRAPRPAWQLGYYSTNRDPGTGVSRQAINHSRGAGGGEINLGISEVENPEWPDDWKLR